MAEYIRSNAAITIADYAADEHPYDKDPARPETYSDYNQGWNDACDYIRERLENAVVAADVAPVRHGRLLRTGLDEYYGEWGECSVCGWDNPINAQYCNGCGAKMDRRDER